MHIALPAHHLLDATRPPLDAPHRPLPELLAAVGDLYQAAFDAERWPEALAAFARTVGARECRLEVQGKDGALELAVATPHRGCAAAMREESHFDWSAGGRRLQLLLTYSPGDCGVEERRSLGALLPHLERAARLSIEGRPLYGARAVLDRLAAGVVLVDARGRASAGNRSAEDLLAEGRALELHRGRLRAVDPAQREGLEALLRRVLPKGPGAPPPRGGVVTLAGDGRALQVVGAPLEPGWGAGPAAPAALLLLSEGGAPACGLAEALADAYGLTPGETRVALRLLNGDDVDTIGERLGVSRETVRTHLKRLFGKVGTTRQADLLRLLLTGAGRVRWD